jgi:hypothetical protein
MERTMKKIVVVLVSLFLFAVQAEAKNPPVTPKPAVPPCPMMGNMQMPCPMMGNMKMSCPMAGLMQSMIDVMKIEQQILVESKGMDKNALKAELTQKMAALEKQMADMKCGMPAPPQAPVSGAGTVPCPMQNGMPCNMTVQPLK